MAGGLYSAFGDGVARVVVMLAVLVLSAGVGAVSALRHERHGRR